MKGQIPEPLLDAADQAMAEVLRAKQKHGPEPFHGAHEGYAVLLEEVDELWDAIKADDWAAARKEAVQVAAMALRFISEIPTERKKRGAA